MAEKAAGMATALILTIAIEMGMLMLMGEKRRKVLLTSVWMNAATNIALNMYITFVRCIVWEVIAAEVIIIIIEAAGYYLVTKDKKKSITYSTLCNGVSCFAGVIMSIAKFTFTS